jgi:hypothetical protein
VSRKPLDEFEVLSDAGWLFDDFVNAEMRKVLVSQPEDRDQREPDRNLRSGFGAAPSTAPGAWRQAPWAWSLGGPFPSTYHRRARPKR